MSHSTPLSLHSALVVRSPFDAALLDRYRRQSGEIDIHWTPTTVLMKNIENGQQCDVVIVTDPAMDQLVAQGIVDPATRKPLVISRIGFAVKQGAPHVDVSGTEQLVNTLRNGRSICYSIGGASGIHFKAVLQKLGIEQEIDAKACPIPEGFTAEKLISGEADLAIQQISELLVVPGVEIVGYLPDELQKVTAFSIARFANSERKQQAAELIDIVTAANTADEYQKFGLELRN